jgi:bifunctional NMN adenylyltransferase/nudix hydrolase
MTNEQPDIIGYIGRFQPAHKAHIETIERACMIARKRVVILVGSANQPRTIKNPWTWNERADMIYASLTPAAKEKVTILPLRDILYNDPAWEQSVQEIFASVADEDDTIKLIGYTKDETSYYMKAFPQWGDPIEMENIEDLHATDIRTAMFEDKDFDAEIGRYLPKGIHDYIKSFMLTTEYDKLVSEYEFKLYHDRMWNMDKRLDYFLERELPSFSAGERRAIEAATILLRNNYRVAPYEPTFNTTDMIVVKSGHILLVRRRAAPGLGLYAMPGGYLNPKEWSKDGALRELKEETKIKDVPAIIRSNIKADDVFEHPERSTRGRIITRAFISELPSGGPLPKITAADDAERAKWVPLSVFEKMEDQMFEDHYHIIKIMLARLPKENR